MRISDWSSDVCSSDLNDVNRVDTRGGRGTFRFDAGDGWTVDLGGVYQAITSHDAQYADKDAPPLTRRSMVEQNARSRHALGTPVVAKDWGELFLQSSTAILGHRLFELFAESRPCDPPRLPDHDNPPRLLAREHRLPRHTPPGP